MMEKIKEYAKCLCEEDAKIEEVILIGSFADGTANDKSDIDLVCVFDEDTFGKLSYVGDYIDLAYKRLWKLREKIAEFEKNLKLGYPIDLCFTEGRGSDIFGGGGLISNYAGKYKTLIKRKEGLNETTKKESLPRQ